ncbi:hypothetical protein F5880DRAFT_1613075 [Lentinula raphanica]|nr:hypothetical protein F5880DRAFT_1613075 [Lentinula raphanica]
MLNTQFVLLEAEEHDDWEQDSSDDETNDEGEGSSHATEIPSQYRLPPANSSTRMELVVEHLEEVIHRPRARIPRPNVRPSPAKHKRFITSKKIARKEIARKKIGRRAASVPVVIPRVFPRRARRSMSAPPSTAGEISSSRLELHQDTGLAVNGTVGSDGEVEDCELEDVELTAEQRLMNRWIKKYLGPLGLAISGYKLFYVRCERQYERKVVQRIRADIQDQKIDSSILRAAFPSSLPGGIYLQAQSMLPQNTTLASYLLTIPGLLYPKAPRVVFSTHQSAHSIPAASARTDLVLPLHSVVEDPASIEGILRESSYFDDHPPHTWIKCKRGLYKDNVGLVVADDFNEIDYDVERLVLFPPRLDLSRALNLLKGQTSFKRKRNLTKRPDILPWTAAELVTQNYCIPNQLDCARHCGDSQSCAHSEPAQKRFICLGQHWQNGLIFKRVNLVDMEPASEISTDVRYYFLASNHFAVQQSLPSMPPPSSWEFQIGEAVRFTDFDGTWCTPEGQYKFDLPAGQTKGIIHYVGSSYCEIDIPLQGSNVTVNSLHTLSKSHLEKIFSPGDTALLLSGARRRLSLNPRNHRSETLSVEEEICQTGKEGLVISVRPGKVEVLLQENDENVFLDFHPNVLKKVEQLVSDHDVLRNRPRESSTAKESSAKPALCEVNPFTNEVPWRNLRVYPTKYSHKGYRAEVVDARSDSNTVSGLSVQIRYEAQGMSNHFAWIDYDYLRRVDNNRFLHDLDGLGEANIPTNWNSYWNLNPDYSPKYSDEELYLLEKGSSPEGNASVVSTDSPSRTTTPFSSPPDTETELDPAWDPSSPDPPAQHWLLDPRIVKGIPEGLELLVATTTHPDRDQRVFFKTTNGITKLYSIIGNRKGGRKPSQNDIVEVDPSTILDNPRSLSVPSHPGVAKGLYLICTGDRTGELCRRVSFMMRFDPSKPSRWLVHAVKVIRKPTTRIQYEEYLDSDIGTHWVEGTDLIAIHETNTMRTIANTQLEPIRRLYPPVHE